MIGRFLGAISLSKIPSQLRKLGLMVLTAIAVFAVIYFAAYTKSGFELELSTVAPFLLVIALNLGAFMLGKSMPARTLAVFAVVNIVLLLTTITTSGMLAFWTEISTT